MQRSVNVERWWIFYFPNRRWNSKTVWKRSRSFRIHSWAGSTCKKWTSQRRTWRKLGEISAETRGRWCSQRLLVDWRRLSLSSSCWTSSSSLCQKKNHSQYHWSKKTWPGQVTQIWMWCKESVSTTMDCWWPSNSVRFVDRIYEVLKMVREALDEDPSNYQTRFLVAQDLDWHVESSQKARMGSWGAKVWQCSKTEEYLLHPSAYQETTQKKVTKKLATLWATAIPWKMGTRRCFKGLRETIASGDTHRHKKTKCVWKVEVHESSRNRLESTLPMDHDDHIAEKGLNSLSLQFCA